jgi:uncharacterized coiled-coil protein SlyX
MEANIMARFDALETKFEKRLTELEAAVNFVSQKYDDMTKESAAQKSLIVDLKKGLDGVHDKLREKDSTISQLTARINQIEQADLSLNLEIHGIPKTDGENLLEKLHELAVQVGAPLPEEAFADAYRRPVVPPRAPGERPRGGEIIVKCKAPVSTRRGWWRGGEEPDSGVRRQTTPLQLGPRPPLLLKQWLMSKI